MCVRNVRRKGVFRPNPGIRSSNDCSKIGRMIVGIDCRVLRGAAVVQKPFSKRCNGFGGRAFRYGNVIPGGKGAARKGEAGAVLVKIKADKRLIHAVAIADGDIAAGIRNDISEFAFREADGSAVQKNAVKIGDLRVLGREIVRKQANALDFV